MHRSFARVVTVLAALAGLGYVPGAAADDPPPPSGPRYLHLEHLTQLGQRVNEPCPVGTHKIFTARASVSSDDFVFATWPHYLYLTDGRHLPDARSLRRNDGHHLRFVFWASRTAKISPYLSGSFTRVQTASKHIAWTDDVSVRCVSNG